MGFTALSEQVDPEDVDGLLRSYHSLVREVIQQYGGVVEKFIGDAVVGVFGVPAHEDDAERAVRAAVRLQERIADMPGMAGEAMQARVGINTGRALVRLDVDPASGAGFLAGDAVNTAARLQTVAPPGGVCVGEMTHSLASRAATYEAMGPVHLKGKARITRPWLVTGGITIPGVDLKRSFATPFVGREVELGILNGMFDKARASAAPQFVFLIADAGLGKSRLLHELAKIARPAFRRDGLLAPGEMSGVRRGLEPVAAGADRAPARRHPGGRRCRRGRGQAPARAPRRA